MVLPVILGIVAGLVLLLVLILALPVDLALRVRREERTRVAIRVRWLWASFQKGLMPRKPRAAEPPEEKPPAAPRKKRGPVRWPRYVLAAARTEGFLLRVLRLGPDLLRTLRLRELLVDLRLGLDDPALTGECYGGLCTVLVPLQSLTGSRLRIEPCFDGPVLEGSLETEIRVVPARILGAVLAFALSGPTLRAGRAVLQERFR
jgi:hypothetical protein